MNRIEKAQDRLLLIICMILLRMVMGKPQGTEELSMLTTAIVDWRYTVTGDSKETKDDLAWFGIERDYGK